MLRARAFWALIILVLGQIHLCQAEWVRPTGEDCGECARELAGPVSGALTDDSCLDCCELAGCNDAERQELRLALPAVKYAILPSPVLVPVCIPVVAPVERLGLIEAAPAHAPPPLRASRAPPILLS